MLDQVAKDMDSLQPPLLMDKVHRKDAFEIWGMPKWIWGGGLQKVNYHIPQRIEYPDYLNLQFHPVKNEL